MHLPKMKWMAAVFLVMVFVVPYAVYSQNSNVVLKAQDVKNLLPESVYYRGQHSAVQARNSAGVKFLDGYYVLVTLVDTGGYSTDVATKYQAYLIAEVPLRISGSKLVAGAYGIGFVGNDKMVVTDVGGHDVLVVNAHADNEIKRPMPMQILADPEGGFRLYAGRKYVVFTR